MTIMVPTLALHTQDRKDDKKSSELNQTYRKQNYHYVVLTIDYAFLTNNFGSFSVILAAILDLRHHDYQKMIKYLQDRLP
jgi:hypothetical protein